MADKKELNLEEMEKMAGGMNPNSVSPEEWEKIMDYARKHHLTVGCIQKPQEIEISDGKLNNLSVSTKVNC